MYVELVFFYIINSLIEIGSYIKMCVYSNTKHIIIYYQIPKI